MSRFSVPAILLRAMETLIQSGIWRRKGKKILVAAQLYSTTLSFTSCFWILQVKRKCQHDNVCMYRQVFCLCDIAHLSNFALATLSVHPLCSCFFRTSCLRKGISCLSSCWNSTDRLTVVCGRRQE